MTQKQPFRIKVFEDTGRTITEICDDNPDNLIKKTNKFFKEKF